MPVALRRDEILLEVFYVEETGWTVDRRHMGCASTPTLIVPDPRVTAPQKILAPAVTPMGRAGEISPAQAAAGDQYQRQWLRAVLGNLVPDVGLPRRHSPIFGRVDIFA